MSEVSDNITDHLDMLKRYAISLTRNGDAAEDLVQATVLRALYKAHLYEPGSNLRGWLLCMMRNLYLTGRRAPYVRRRSLVDPFDILRDESIPAAQTGTIEAREICAAIARMSPKLQRMIHALIEGDTYAEMAADQGIPLGTVQSRCNRARAALAEMMEVA